MPTAIGAAHDRDRRRAAKPRVATGTAADRVDGAGPQGLAAVAQAHVRHSGLGTWIGGDGSPDRVDRRSHQARLRRPGVLPPGADRHGWATVPGVEVPDEARWRVR